MKTWSWIRRRRTEMFRICTCIISSSPSARRAVVQPVVLEKIPVAFGEECLTNSVQAVQLVEHVEFDDVLIFGPGDEFGGVGKLAGGGVGDLGDADLNWIGLMSS